MVVNTTLLNSTAAITAQPIGVVAVDPTDVMDLREAIGKD